MRGGFYSTMNPGCVLSKLCVLRKLPGHQEKEMVFLFVCLFNGTALEYLTKEKAVPAASLHDSMLWPSSQLPLGDWSLCSQNKQLLLMQGHTQVVPPR